MRLDFIGVGFGRSGSKWLVHCLSEHPELSIPKFNLTTEINYFPEEYEVMGLKNYLKKFKSCDFSKKVGELSTLIIFQKRSAKLLKKLFPDVKIIIYRRDEEKRAESEYNIHKYSDLRNDFKKRVVNQEELIAPFIKEFGKSNVHIFDMENKNKQLELDKLCDFLKIKHFTPSVINKRFGSSYSFDKTGTKKIRGSRFPIIAKTLNRIIKPLMRRNLKIYYTIKRSFNLDYIFQKYINHKMRDRTIQDFK